MRAATGIRESSAQSILTPVSGFLAQAGFTHSLTPARNCTYGCTYCYVPSMRIYGGLKQEDWRRWGQFTTFKINAAQLIRKSRHASAVIYCSPLVDPYQPAESSQRLMPEILTEFHKNPPRILVLQTRSPLILRDIDLLRRLSAATILRISFSITTNRADVERLYEPRCEPNSERLDAIQELNRAGLEAYATLAPILPCDPEDLALQAIKASGRTLIGDPLHNRASKPFGATTREAALKIGEKFDELNWFCPETQQSVVDVIGRVARVHGLDFATGPKGFSWLTR
jgi:DNA repair photolyase